LTSKLTTGNNYKRTQKSCAHTLSGGGARCYATLSAAVNQRKAQAMAADTISQCVNADVPQIFHMLSVETIDATRFTKHLVTTN
jgi:hypothetical protein